MSANQSDEQALADEIEQLQREYRETLTEKCLKIDELLSEPMAALSRPDWGFKLPEWKPARDFVHKIAGSSGTYGFQTLSETLRFLEDRIMDGSLSPLPASTVRQVVASWRAFLDTVTKHYLSLPVTNGYTEILSKADEQSLRPQWKKIENELILAINVARSRRQNPASDRRAA